MNVISTSPAFNAAVGAVSSPRTIIEWTKVGKIVRWVGTRNQSKERIHGEIVGLPVYLSLYAIVVPSFIEVDESKIGVDVLPTGLQVGGPWSLDLTASGRRWVLISKPKSLSSIVSRENIKKQLRFLNSSAQSGRQITPLGRHRRISRRSSTPKRWRRVRRMELK